jgi:hypothetical protein
MLKINSKKLVLYTTLISILFINISGFAQEQSDKDSSLICNFSHNFSYIQQTPQILQPDPEIENMVWSLLTNANVGFNFKILHMKVNDAMATTDNFGNRYIIYDAQTLRSLAAQTPYNTKALFSILAHEIGHHVANHKGGYTNDTNRNYKRELEADHYAGMLLYFSNIPLEVATSLYNTINYTTSNNHPHPANRIQEVSSGFRNGGNLQTDLQSMTYLKKIDRSDLSAELNKNKLPIYQALWEKIKKEAEQN